MHNGNTFLVDVVVVGAVVVDTVNVSSTENVSASLQGSISSPHCLQKHIRNFASIFLHRMLLDHDTHTRGDHILQRERSIAVHGRETQHR